MLVHSVLLVLLLLLYYYYCYTTATSNTTISTTTIVITILLLHTLLLGGCHENVQTIFRSPLLVRPRGTAIQVVKDRILCGELIGKFNKTG